MLIEGSSASSRRLVGEPHVGEWHAWWWPAGHLLSHRHCLVSGGRAHVMWLM